MVLCRVCGGGVGGSGFVVCGHCRRKQQEIERWGWFLNGA